MSVLTTLSNVSIIVGPILGGFCSGCGLFACSLSAHDAFAAVAYSRLGFRPQMASLNPMLLREKADGEDGDARASFAMSIKTVFTNTLLLLLFVIMFLTNFGYGAFDPLESFFYRDVLHVGVEWMGWLSSASGVGAVVGALLVLRMPARLVNLKTLLVALAAMGCDSLVYVGTPYVAVALWGRLPWEWQSFIRFTTPLCGRQLPALRQLGRVNSGNELWQHVCRGGSTYVVAPWLAARFGVQSTLVGAACIVTAVPMVFAPLWASVFGPGSYDGGRCK